MTRITALLLVALPLGCAKDAGPLSQPPADDRKPQLAAYAAQAAPPPKAPTTNSSLHVTAVVRREERTITLHNFSDQPLKDVEVWVDAAYVRNIPEVPARDDVTVHFAQFYDARGASLAARTGAIGRVQFKVGGALHDAIGPAHD